MEHGCDVDEQAAPWPLARKSIYKLAAYFICILWITSPINVASALFKQLVQMFLSLKECPS
jgi:hypothetical protein